MLNIRVIAPAHLCDAARDLIADDLTVADVVQVAGTGDNGLLIFDVARENANEVLAGLRGLHIERVGSITLSDPLITISDAARASEAHAPGHPDDALVWEQIEDQARDSSQWSWSFIGFLLLATLIASVGRYTDQPILIVGAMVVGPEFAPISAVCVALVRGHLSLIPRALGTLSGGFVLVAAVTWALWAIAYGLGWIDVTQATSGEFTNFIVAPDVWSFLIALLAGCAGVLSLTSSKSAALVGVFISVTTVPAVATIGLTLAVGAWAETWAAFIQLLLNVARLLIAGTTTLLGQWIAWHRFGRLPKAGVTPRSAA